jgi:hypothetical protein
MPLFEIIFIWSTWSGYIAVFAAYGGDNMFLGICSYISAQFDVVSMRLENLFKEEIGK